jgi:hypothetical protein
VSVTLQPHLIPGKDPIPIVQEAGWASGPVWTGAENLAPTGIFLLYHVQYTFIMSCWNSWSPLYTPSPGSPFPSHLHVHDSHHYHTALGARKVNLFTDSVHSPVSRHPSIRTYEIIQGLTDSSLLGSHVRLSRFAFHRVLRRKSNYSCAESVQRPRVLHHTM